MYRSPLNKVCYSDVVFQCKSVHGRMWVTSTVGGVLNVKDERRSGRAVFFWKSKLPLKKWLLIIHFWSIYRQLPVTDAELQLEISRSTAIDIYQWLREDCSTKLLSTPIVLGGPRKVIQIDESLFNHKPKIKLSVYPTMHVMTVCP